MNEWVERDLKHNWHPYTQMKDCRRLPPLLIERARGLKLYDADGRWYYDTIASWWCNVHGHNHPRIREAVRRQVGAVDHVLFAGFTHKPAILLAEKLTAIAPRGLTRVFFSDNGSTAVEVALKMSFQYWQNVGRGGKREFIALDHGYHGDTIGAMSVSGPSLFNERFASLLFPAHKVPSPYCYRCPMCKAEAVAAHGGRGRVAAGRSITALPAPPRFSPGRPATTTEKCASPPACAFACLGPLEAVLKKRANKIAAIILEPLVMAAGGMIIYPPAYLRRVAELAREHGVHLILDEVATGFGRTGTMFACEQARVRPDFLCLSKGLTSGYLPLGATLTTAEVYRAFYADYAERKTFYHGHTYTANPIACAAALASLRVFEEEGTLARVRGLLPAFHAGMERFRSLPLVGDVRYLGLIGAVELVKDRATKEPFGLRERIGLAIYREGLKRGLVLRPLGHIIYLFLPLCVKERELDTILAATYDVVQAVVQRRGISRTLSSTSRGERGKRHQA